MDPDESSRGILAAVISGNQQAIGFHGNARFEIVRRIGAGGIGLVYEAIDREYNNHVALKTLQRLDSTVLVRFKNEFRLLQDLHHHNLIRLGELFEEQGRWFFTMELLDGVDFITHVAAQTADHSHAAATAVLGPPERLPKPLPDAPDFPNDGSDNAPPTASTAELPRGSLGPALDNDASAHTFDETRLRSALSQLAFGLLALHQAGMVHRDIKPKNVMVCAGRVVLLDFGLVSEERPWHRYRWDEGMVLGTPLYMAPEQASGQVATQASDWYSVGTILYEALTGTRPYEGQTARVLMDKLAHDPIPPSLRVREGIMIPSDLERLCLDLLRRNPRERPSGKEVLARLRSAAPDVHLAAISSAAIAADRGVPFFGREPELSQLRHALSQVQPGQPRLALVHGKSGMGKSALIEHFAREVRDREGVLVLRGRCYEREAVPYKAFDGIVDDLSRYLRELYTGFYPDDDAFPNHVTRKTLPPPVALSRISTSSKLPPDLGIGHELDGDRDEFFDPAFAVIERLFPVLAGVFQPPEPDLDDDTTTLTGQHPLPRPSTFGSDSRDDFSITGLIDDSAEETISETHVTEIRDLGQLRLRAFAALKRLLNHITRYRSLVVIIDDLQWGDRDSAALLSEILAAPGAPGLFLIASYRNEESDSQVIQTLRNNVKKFLRRQNILDIEVGPLSHRECMTLARAVWRRLNPGNTNTGRIEPLVKACAFECAGSPFFVGEMMRYCATVAEDGALTTAASGVTLEQMVVSRRNQLDPGARALLDVIAVAGHPITRGVALRAANLEAGQLEAFDVLRAGHFVRTHGPSIHDPVETYHDRIREAVVASLDSAALRRSHNGLANALTSWGSGDAEILAEHFRGAGRIEHAIRHARTAAANAERMLAFDSAARMYRLLIDVDGGPKWRLYLALGDALANADRGIEAAEAYLRATSALTLTGIDTSARDTSVRDTGVTDAGRPSSVAPAQSDEATGDDDLQSMTGFEEIPAAMAVECRRRAAEQLCRSGDIDHGLALMRDLMTTLGIYTPPTPRRALFSLLFHRARLYLRGLSYQPKPDDASAELLALADPLDPSYSVSLSVSNAAQRRRYQRIDVCWSAAVSLSAVDRIRGADYATRCLLMALVEGNEERIAVALAFEATHLIARGGWRGRWLGERRRRRALRMAREATRIARQLDYALARGVSAFASAALPFYNGRWRLANHKFCKVEQIFRDRCRGASWEFATVRMHRCLALFYLGEWAALSKIAATAGRHARDRDDQFTASMMACFTAYGALVVDDVNGARRDIRDAAALWSASGYHLQHYLQLLSGVQVDLYAGDAERAYQRMREERVSLRRSLLLQIQMTRIESSHLMARCALALASLRPAAASGRPSRYRRRTLLKQVKRIVSMLGREKLAWSRGLRQLLQAGLAAHQGRKEPAIAALNAAMKTLGSCEMALYAAAAKRQLGRLHGGHHGAHIIATADVAMRARGIVEPAKVADMLVPGFGAEFNH